VPRLGSIQDKLLQVLDVRERNERAAALRLLVQVGMVITGVHEQDPRFSIISGLFEQYEMELYGERYIPGVEAAWEARLRRKADEEAARKRHEELTAQAKERERLIRVDNFDRED
jgi:hypothetical protein